MVRATAAGSAVLLAACSPDPGAVDVAESKGGDFLITGVSDVTQIAQLTGPDSRINDTEAVAVAGTDLGSMFTAGERTFFVFGDTFGERDPESHGGQGSNWRSNVLAYTTDDDPSDGITFDGWITDDIGFAAEAVPGAHDPNGVGEVTKIPTFGFAVDDVLYLAFMSVHLWGEPGEWEANYAGLARSDDGGQNWTELDIQWPGDSNFIQVSTVEVSEDGEDYLYFFSIPAGRTGPVQLMKVPASTGAVEDLGSYRYFTGTDGDGAAQWSQEMDAAVDVVPGQYGELSVIYSEQLQRWLLTTMRFAEGDAVLLEGLNPWGPWSEPHVITDQVDSPGLYGPYTHPDYVSDDGRTLYFTLSLWGPYNVFWYSLDLEISNP